MKYAKFAAVVFVLFFLGYVLGPMITPMLVSPKEAEMGLTRDVKYRGATYTINLAEFRDGDLPTTLTIENPTEIPTTSGEGTVRLKKGDVVTLLNRKDDVLIVEKDDANGKGTIDPMDTDLFAQLAKQIYDKEAGDVVAKVDPPVVPPAPAPKPAPAPIPPVVAADPQPAPTPTPMPVVDPDPTPAPEPTPAPAAGGKLSDEDVIDLMKKSIAGGAVKEFTIDQVKGWKATGDETIDGTEYQTGLAAYEAATIFGVRPVQAKALIKGGAVERWVYAKSGMEIQ